MPNYSLKDTFTNVYGGIYLITFIFFTIRNAIATLIIENVEVKCVGKPPIGFDHVKHAL